MIQHLFTGELEFTLPHLSCRAKMFVNHKPEKGIGYITECKAFMKVYNDWFYFSMIARKQDLKL